MDLNKLFEFAMKNGARGLLIIWVFTLSLKVDKLETAYSDCMGQRITDLKGSRWYQADNTRPFTPYRLAILPETLRIKED